jgi:hypothetical protein
MVESVWSGAGERRVGFITNSWSFGVWISDACRVLCFGGLARGHTCHIKWFDFFTLPPAAASYERRVLHCDVRIVEGWRHLNFCHRRLAPTRLLCSGNKHARNLGSRIRCYTYGSGRQTSSISIPFLDKKKGCGPIPFYYPFRFRPRRGLVRETRARSVDSASEPDRTRLGHIQTQSRKNRPICQVVSARKHPPQACTSPSPVQPIVTKQARALLIVVFPTRRRWPYMLPTAAARRTASVVVAARVGEARSCSVPTTDGTAASPLFNIRRSITGP